MARVLLSMGTNIGDRNENLLRSVLLIRKYCGEIISESGIYESEAWGYESSHRFYNKAVLLDTSIEHSILLSELKRIEKEMGREEKRQGYSDRIIDIDIIFYNDLVISIPDLTIPHPLMEKRRFVLEPLCEIAPGFVHPVLKKTVKELLDSLS